MTSELPDSFFCDSCNHERETPFCAVCGERLTDNKFIGHNLQHLESECEEAARESRQARDQVQSLERKHEAEMAPAKERLSKAAAVCRDINQAKDWARENDIQHPNYRR